jgi:hypothetical protein
MNEECDERAQQQHGGAPRNVQGGTADLLTQAVECAVSMLADGARPTKESIRLLWAASKMALHQGGTTFNKRRSGIAESKL